MCSRPNLRPYNQRKLQFRSKQCVFLGNSHIHKGYKCLCVSTDPVYISQDVVFDEGIFSFSSNSNSHDHPSLTSHSTCQPFPLASPFNANLDVGDDHMINELSNAVPFEFSGDLMQPHDVGIQPGEVGAALPGATATLPGAAAAADLPCRMVPQYADGSSDGGLLVGEISADALPGVAAIPSRPRTRL